MAQTECLVIEDSKHGLKAAQEAGMRCMTITTSYKREELVGSDLIVDSLVGLTLEPLEKLFA